MNIKINKYFVCEFIEHYLSQLGFYYVANKSNQKKIIELFHSMPFFFFDQNVQNILYKVIQKNNITAYIDSNENMKHLCFNIYKDFCLNLKYPYKSFQDFYDSILFKLTSDKYYMRKMKQNHIHSFIFSILFIGILCVYYIISKRLYP